MPMDERGSNGRTRKIIGILLLITLLLLGGLYAAGVLYFRSHFLPGTIINGYKCEFMTTEQVEDLLTRETEVYELAVLSKDGGVEGVTAGEIGLTYRSEGEAAQTLAAQNIALWPLALTGTREITLDKAMDVDENLLSQTVSQLKCVARGNENPPKDAAIEKKNDEYQIVPEEEGLMLDTSKVMDELRTAARSGNRELDLEERDCYLLPAVTADDPIMQENLAYVQKITQTIITYDFADRKETVDGDTVFTWLTYDEDGRYELDWDQAAAFVEELADTYNTFGTERSFRTYDGQQITVSGGNYGWVIDEIHETEELLEAIENAAIEVRTPVYSYEAFSRDTNDIGYTYIEISLSAQKLVYYVDGYPQVETSIISGIPGNSDYATPTGVYKVSEKLSPYTDTREQISGNWYLTFYNSLGIHDAPGRDDFYVGANVDAGTAGCIEVPSEAMQTVYQQVETGTPVVIY